MAQPLSVSAAVGLSVIRYQGWIRSFLWEYQVFVAGTQNQCIGIEIFDTKKELFQLCLY